MPTILLNVRPQACRLDTRRHFFSRVVESWNSIPSSLKQAETVRAFKNSYRDYRAMAEGTARVFTKVAFGISRKSKFYTKMVLILQNFENFSQD